ncbi:MAG TPA: hypothetical protein VGI77_01100 [Gaiellaceae bacterium]
MRRLVVASLVLFLVGCTASKQPSRAEQRATAQSFAKAVLAGNDHAARSLVAAHTDRAVDEQAKRLSAGFAVHSAHFNGRSRRSGTAQWAFPYRRRINGKNGAFSVERGFLVVDTGTEPGVTFAAIIGRMIVRSTHHDSVLLPSKR